MATDVIVVGAGPAGCSAAYHLAKGGARVALLDRAEFPRGKVCGDALSPYSLALLDRMGLEGIREDACRITGSLVVAPNGRRMTTYTAEPGATLRRRELDRRLLDRAQAAGAEFLPGREFIGLSRRRAAVAVQTADGEEALGRCVVLATGCNAAALKAAGLLGVPAGPSALGCRAYFEGVRCPDEKIVHSFDRYLLPGFGWIFPMGGGRANVGVAVHLQAVGKLSLRQKFDRFVRDSLVSGDALRDAARVSPVRCAPLRTGLRGARLVAERLLAVGDAAGAATPSNGEGIRGALETGRLAALTIGRALDEGDLSARGLGSYAAAVRRTCGRRFRQARWARRALRWPASVNALVACGGGDEVLADRLSWMLTGDVPLRFLASPLRLMRMVLGVGRRRITGWAARGAESLRSERTTVPSAGGVPSRQTRA